MSFPKQILILTSVIFSMIMVNTAFSEEFKDGLYAKFDTNKGQIIVMLYFEVTPLTTINFAGLAQGSISTQEGKSKKYYDGLTFHRVIDNFMIQGGDPRGTGTGGPGYKFPDEFSSKLKHDSPGILSMANSGPETNGSQFFITHKATPWLDNKHTVFGKVVQGQDVVDKIQKGDKIITLTILRVGEKAKNFKTDQQSFDNELKKIEAKAALEAKKTSAKFETEMYLRYPKAIKTKSGLMYVITREGQGEIVQPGNSVLVHYNGKFKDGKMFDSSYDRGKPVKFAAGVGQVIKGWDEALVMMKKGEKRTLMIPYYLAYGEKGYPGAIPPKADLIFDVEIIDFK